MLRRLAPRVVHRRCARVEAVTELRSQQPPQRRVEGRLVEGSILHRRRQAPEVHPARHLQVEARFHRVRVRVCAEEPVGHDEPGVTPLAFEDVREQVPVEASTLVIRALALNELRLKDWRRVLGRELKTGLALGLILGAIGVLRIFVLPPEVEAQAATDTVDVALVVGASVAGVVLWGATMGAMLPLLLHRAGFDPASASAPFVATLVDVTGLIIYFSVATAVLKGTLL